MGLKFRKSIKMGPVRVNLSKSGVSTSVGVKGARVSLSSKGKARATVGIPGTGISYSKNFGGKKKSASMKKKRTNSVASVPTEASTPAAPIKRSWPIAIILTILAFAVVGGVSFVVAFLCYAAISLFNSGFGGTIGSKILVFGIPAVLAVLAAVVAFFTTRPDAKSDTSPLDEEPVDHQ